MRCCAASYPGSGPVAPPGGVFSDDLNEMCAWATQLDNSYVAVQGPPGTGKTYRAAHGPCPGQGRSAGRDHRPQPPIHRERAARSHKGIHRKGDLELLNGVRVKTTGSQPELEGFTYGKADKAAGRSSTSSRARRGCFPTTR